MAKANPSTINLKSAGTPHYENFPLAPLDGCGNGAITPGIEISLAGNTCVANSVISSSESVSLVTVICPIGTLEAL